MNRAAVESAATRIAAHVRSTPVLDLEPGIPAAGARVSLKLELFQHSGSFKPRGAYSALLAAEIPAAGVVAASGGNFALAVAHAAGRLGIPAAIFVPEASSATKVERLRESAAEVFIAGALYADALDASREHARSIGALELHAYDDPAVIAGQGTCGRELAEQRPRLDTVLVAVGGGGLIAGVASWYGSDARIVGVETDGTPALARALEAGEPVEVEVDGIAADSLGARSIGRHPWEVISRQVDRSVLVSDDAVRQAQRWLWRNVRVLAEPGGAAGIAALLAGAYEPAPGERLGVLVCGGNTDPAAVA